MATRTVKVILSAIPTGFVAGFATARKSAADFGAELDKATAKSSGNLNKITHATGMLGLGLTAAFGLAIKAAYDFDKQMSAVGAVAGANATQLGQLRAAALQAGKDTAYTATQAAQAEEELAKAGISTADILSGGLKGALSLAAAGSLDLADAAKYASQAMIEFNLSGKDVAHIADVLTAGANKSVTDVQGLGEALGQAGTMAHQAGMNLDETVGVLAMFAQHGLDGVEAGTTFKQMLIKLEAPSDKAKALMQQLGLNVYDAQGHFKSAADLADALQKSLGGLTEQQRNAALATIFGSRAVRGAVDLYNAGANGVNDWTQAVNDSGIAARTAAARQDNLAGDLHKLRGSLDALAISSSGGATKGLRVLTQAATGLTNVITGLPTPLTSTLTVLTGVGGVSLLAATGFVKARSTGKQFLDTLTAMGPTGEKAAGALGKIGSFGAKLGIAGIATFGLVEGLIALRNWSLSSSKPVKRDIDALTASINEFASAGRIGGELAKAFGKDLSGLSGDLLKVAKANVDLVKMQQAIATASSALNKGYAEHISGMRSNLITADTAQARSDIAALDSALANIATQGGAAQAKIAFQDLAAKEGLSAAQTQQLLDLLPNYQKAMQGAAAANSGAAQGFGTAASNAQTLAVGLQAAIDAGQKFTDVWNQLNGAMLGTDQARLAASKAIDDVTKALKANKDAWKGNSEAALDDRVKIGLAAQKAAEVAQAVYEQTGSVNDAKKAYDGYIEQLRKALLKLGLSKTAVDELLAAYAQMPPMVTTIFNTPGLVMANNTASGYAKLLNDIPSSVTTTISTNYTSSHQKNRWGGVYEHAAVGALRDPQIFSSVSTGARYAFAEPATGGEAFIPKYGNWARSMGILNHAASWYGARVMPAGAGGGGVAAVSLNVAFSGATDSMFATAFQKAVRTGQIQMAAVVNGKRIPVGV